MFCTRKLRLSEQAAYSRITAARAARRFPDILARLTHGALSLSSVGLLAPHLTDDTAAAMLEAAAGKSTREVERLIASWHPQPDVPSVLRALPVIGRAAPAGALLGDQRTAMAMEPLGESAGQRAADPVLGQTASLKVPPRTVVAPIAPRRYLLKLTLDQDTHDKLQHARASLRHTIPDGDPGKVLGRALDALLGQVERTKGARSSRSRRVASAIGKGRNVPAAVRREVCQRDGGRCVFSGADGPCGETAFLEYHHVVPFAAGGETSAANLQLRCRAHNQFEALDRRRMHQARFWV